MKFRWAEYYETYGSWDDELRITHTLSRTKKVVLEYFCEDTKMWHEIPTVRVHLNTNTN